MKNPEMNRIVQFIIVDSINASQSINRNDLLRQVCADMEDRYKERLDTLSKNLGLATTKDVLNNIDIYLSYYYPKHKKKGLINFDSTKCN